MDKISKFLNLAPDFFRSKTTWLAFSALGYFGYKYSQHAISLDQLIDVGFVVLFGASLRDTIAKVFPALLTILGDVRGTQGNDGG